MPGHHLRSRPVGEAEPGTPDGSWRGLSRRRDNRSGLREAQEQVAPGPEGQLVGGQQAQPGLQRSECRHGAGPLLPGEPGVLPLPTACVLPSRWPGCSVHGGRQSLSKQHFTQREPLFYVSSEIDIEKNVSFRNLFMTLTATFMF